MSSTKEKREKLRSLMISKENEGKKILEKKYLTISDKTIMLCKPSSLSGETQEEQIARIRKEKPHATIFTIVPNRLGKK